jgi:hypothetical protein
MKFALIRFGIRLCSLPALVLLGVAEAHADACPTAKDDIVTDRPSVTNSSTAVPTGSFLSENGIDLSANNGGQTISGPNSRWRLGIAPCLEFLVDLPTYYANIRQPGSSGFSDIAPAIKWQISPVPGTVDLSFTTGVALPTGAEAIAGRGAQPYVQLPWSWALNDGWSVSGMLTESFRPEELVTKHLTETTFVLGKKLTDHFSLFTEYVGDYPEGAGPSLQLNSGGVYQLNHTQQVDFHIAVGLNHNAPSYIVGVGYSFRIDGLFAGLPR